MPVFRPRRLKFGIFMAPFHRVGENPTLALERDLELIELLDRLDFDEAWIGEHHSAGWETIASPELMIAAAAQRTRTIKLGTGVVSLPYHHPLMVADRMTQLDHMTRGRVMMGVGPGALASDAYMMGIDPLTQRPRMDEALGLILRLFRGEVVDHKADWCTLQGARMQLAPYSEPHMDVAVASTFSPAGPVTAGKHGVGMLSITASQPGGMTNAAQGWAMAEEEAAKHGKTMDRRNWRVLTSMHLADTREEALRDVEEGMTYFYKEYFGRVIGQPGAFDEWTFKGTLESGGSIVGTPDDAIEAIERIFDLTGGMGGVLFQAHEWTTWAKTKHSYELWARYVAPRFQSQLPSIENSRDWSADNRTTIFAPAGAATLKAFLDAGKEIPAEIVARMQRGKA
ncbi:MAG: LLM class flavin-dependent oxidoreductase [Chloroflexi bacterium]|nr:LLM class flavin-dependent oxidoreductase [Chloroflexota bacterium]